MRIGTILAVVGLVLAALGGLWYWQILRVVAAFASVSGAPNLNQTLRLAIGLVCFGVVLFLLGLVMGMFGKDEEG